MPFKLLDLPEEILLNVLSTSSHREILRSSQTCKRMRALIVSSSAVQYRIQLGKCGMIEGSDASILQKSSDERSKLLRGTIAGRRTFHPTFVHDLGVVSSTDTQYDRAFDLLDGIYVRLTHERINPSSTTGEGIIARLIIKDISGDCREPAIVTQLDVVPEDVSIAPTSDLTVLLTPRTPTANACSVHLRTLSSGGTQRHPDAANPVLQFSDETSACFELDSPEFHLSIDEDIIAIYIPDYFIQVFCWTTGQHIVDWRDRDVSLPAISSFSLISPTCFVVGHSGKTAGRLALYHLPPYDHADAVQQIRIDDLYVYLTLPRIYMDQHTSIRGLFTSPPRSPKGLFEAASRITIMQVLIENDSATTYDDGFGEEVTYVFDKDFFAMFQVDDIHQSGRNEVEWSRWGPQNSRLLHLSLESIPDNSVCSGSRLIYRRTADSFSSTVDDTWEDPFYCLDFGDVHDSSFLQAARDGGAPTGPHARQVIVPNDDQSVHGIRTSLPYYAIETRPDMFNWMNVFIDGNRMICSRSVGDAEGWDFTSEKSIEHVYEL